MSGRPQGPRKGARAAVSKDLGKDICFVLMPFSQRFDNQWELAIGPAVERAGLEALRGDGPSLGMTIIMEAVTDSIYESKVVVADISTDVAGPNANVMYELGLAHAAKKPVVILIQEGQTPPFDLAHVRHLKYHPDKLSKLRDSLADCLREVVDKPAPDLFPQLRLMTKAEAEELDDFRNTARRLKVTVVPEGADIFFNDRLVGATPQTVLVNRKAPRNTVSAAAAEYVEEYKEITEKDLERGEVELRLEPDVKRQDVDWNKLVPKWLRLRRRYPNNPVLMRAVAKYLVDARVDGDFPDEALEEALEEADDLLKAAPDWYMSPVMYGYILLKAERMEESYDYFRRAVGLNPDHYVGYFNMAYVDAKRGNLKDCMKNLKKLSAPKRAESYGRVKEDLFTVCAEVFAPVRESPEYGAEFKALVATLKGQGKKPANK
jgi:tetratricopeptide (TPR) repeat protein